MSTVLSTPLDAAPFYGARPRGALPTLLLSGLQGLRRAMTAGVASSDMNADLPRCSDAQLADLGLSRTRIPTALTGAFFAD